jgi:hypothetical protein
MMEHNDEEEDDDKYHMFPKYGDTATGECEDQQAPKRPVSLVSPYFSAIAVLV